MNDNTSYLVGMQHLSAATLCLIIHEIARSAEVYRHSDGKWYFRNADTATFDSRSEGMPGHDDELSALRAWAASLLLVGV